MTSPRGKGLMDQDGDFVSRYVNDWFGLHQLFYLWALRDIESFAGFMRQWSAMSHRTTCQFCQLVEASRRLVKLCPICGGDGCTGPGKDTQCQRCGGLGMVRRLP